MFHPCGFESHRPHQSVAMSIKIRKFCNKDSGSILKISRASFPQPWSIKEFKKYSKEIFVAEDNKTIIGFVVGKTNNESARIKLVAVDKNHQKQGLGRKLIEYMISRFKKNRAKTVSAHTRIGNKASLSLLKNMGFSVIKTSKNYYTDNEDACLLERTLDG